MTVRVETIARPFDDPRVGLPTIALFERADAMGLLSGEDVRRLDSPTFKRVASRLAEHGIAVGLAPLVGRAASDPERLRVIVERLAESLEGSPVPSAEVRSLTASLEAALLARLVGVSPVTVGRWVRGERALGELHAARVHLLSAVVADLRTAYNERGVRRWFLRPRAQLGGLSPVETLGKGWDPDGPEATRVRELAAWLTSPAAT
jgi:hypothetical protein